MAVRPEQQKRSEDDERLAEAAEIGDRLLDNVSSVLRGKRDEIRLVLAALTCHGHVLFEDADRRRARPDRLGEGARVRAGRPA